MMNHFGSKEWVHPSLLVLSPVDNERWPTMFRQLRESNPFRLRPGETAVNWTELAGLTDRDTKHGTKYDASLEHLRSEILRATEKHPEPRTLFAALMEEIGEALREPEAFSPANREWLQVACVAMRLYTEGGGATSEHVLIEGAFVKLVEALEDLARCLQ